MANTQELIDEIEAAKNRVPVVIALAEISVRQSEIFDALIEEDLEQSREGLEEDFSILRIAGLLRD